MIFKFDFVKYGIIFQIAPVIHEWTYDAMCHDLLDMDGNKYVYEVQIVCFYVFCCLLRIVLGISGKS